MPGWKIVKFQGFTSFVGETPDYSIQVVPSYGGKTVSLYDKLGKREWLEQRDGLNPILPEQMEKEWAELDRMGWDELFPTIDACYFPDGQWIPEHGELWKKQWEGSVDELTLNLNVKSRIVPCLFEKKIKLLDHRRLSIDYCVTNISDKNISFLWAMHPLFKVQPGMRLKLSPDIKQLIVSHSANGRLGNRGQILSWPKPMENIYLSEVGSISEETAEKFFIHPPLEVGYAEIEDPKSGDFLRIEFDPLSIPSLAVWANYGGWQGDYNIAIEPVMGNMDNLDEAMRTGNAVALSAGKSVSWQVIITLGNNTPLRKV